MGSYPTRADLALPYHEQRGADGAFATFDDEGRLTRLEYWRNGVVTGHAVEIDHDRQSVAITRREHMLTQADGRDAFDDPDEPFRDAVNTGIARVWDDVEHERRLRCAFCEKQRHEVARLIAGPTCYICDECVRLCTEIVGKA